MKRRKLSQNERSVLWYAADGRCQRCGIALPDDWHADHITPFRNTGRTNIHELQALCPECNRKKGSMGYRKHQLQFDQACREALMGTIRKVVLSVTPGGGKSFIPQIAAKHLVGHGIDKIAWIVPRDSLRRQGEGNFEDPKDRSIIGHSYRIQATTGRENPSRGHAGFVTSYQAVVAQPFTFEQEFERHRYALILDEAHHLEIESRWHLAIKPLYERAAFVVLMSGTWQRHFPIAFLQYRTGSDGLLYPDIPSGQGHIIRDDTAFITYSRVNALRERAIIPLKQRLVDAEGQYTNRNGQLTFMPSLRDVPRNQASEALFAILQTEYVEHLTIRGIEEFRAYRIGRHPWAKALIIVHTKEQARKVCKLVQKRFPDLRVDYAVSKDDKKESADDRHSMDVVTEFKRNHDSTEPTLDVLVTVGIAYEGLDVKDITHLIVATNIRSRSWIEQAIGRAVRVSKHAPYEEQMGYIYGPDDPLFQEVLQTIIAEQDQGIQLREQDERDGNGADAKSEPRATPMGMQGRATEERQIDLTDGSELPPDKTYKVQYVLKQNKLHGLIDPQTFWRMMNEYEAAPTQASTGPMTPLTPSQEEDRYRKELQAMCADIDSRYFSAEGQKPRWGTANSQVRRVFGKRRNDMTIDELRKVRQWLTENYPLPEKYRRSEI